MLGTEYFLRTEWSEGERLHFPHLALLRPQLATEAQLEHLEGLARTLNSPRLLALMTRTPQWLCHWPLLQALAQNEATPEALRRDLEMVVSLFTMMRELDSSPVAEKAERAEAVKTTYQLLRPDLKPVAKLLAKQLAKPIGGSGTTMELPALPGEDQDWDALLAIPDPPPRSSAASAPQLSPAERAQRARETVQAEELIDAMARGEDEVRAAGLQNPILSEDLLCRALALSPQAALFEEVYQEARWYFRDAVREAFLDAPGCPGELSRKLARTKALLTVLSRRPKEAPALRRTASLLTQLEDSEFQFVTYWAKRQMPQLLRVIKYFYDRLQRRQSSLASSLQARASEGRWASLEERVFAATQATQADQLAQALLDPDLHVVRLALENPALTPRILAAVVPSLDKDRAELLAAHNRWNLELPVRESLLHSPVLEEATALRLLEGLRVFKPLLEILRDPRLPHLEVKRRAQESLRRLYSDMPLPERINVLRAAGGELMRHMPELLQDEVTLIQLVSDRQLDPSLLLRLARNKLTPRAVLERIAGHPVLLAHPAVMSELLLNPKTPREAAARLWGLLSESEQQELLRSPHLPTALRALSQ